MNQMRLDDLIDNSSDNHDPSVQLYFFPTPITPHNDSQLHSSSDLNSPIHSLQGGLFSDSLPTPTDSTDLYLHSPPHHASLTSLDTLSPPRHASLNSLDTLSPPDHASLHSLDTLNTLNSLDTLNSLTKRPLDYSPSEMPVMSSKKVCTKTISSLKKTQFKGKSSMIEVPCKCKLCGSINARVFIHFIKYSIISMAQEMKFSHPNSWTLIVRTALKCVILIILLQ
jgi:hypothetical protein